MATLKLVLFKAKVLSDGTHKIRIAVYHKHETSYIVTRFIVQENQFKDGQVIKRPDAAMINRKLRALLDEYQDKLDSVKHINLYSCSQLKNILLNSGTQDAATFQSVCMKYIEELKEEGRDNYGKLLERNNRYFTEFVKGDILLSDITPMIIESYARNLKVARKLSDTTVNMMMSRTRTIINRGIKHQLVKYDVYPFVSTHIPSSPVKELDISLESLNRIRNSKPTTKRSIVARDLFMLSFYLGGINLIDLLQIDFRYEDVEYIRTKSRNTAQGCKTIIFSIPQEATPIIDRWMNRKTGKLDFGYSFSYSNFSRYLTRSIQQLAEELGITEHVVYYSARKTFAQFASDLGIPDGIIDYCLGHSDKSKGVIRYYTKVRQKQADMALKRVIDYVSNPDKYKEYIELRSDIMLMRA